MIRLLELWRSRSSLTLERSRLTRRSSMRSSSIVLLQLHGVLGVCTELHAACRRSTAADTLHTLLGPWRLLGEGGDLLQTGGDLLGVQSYPLGSPQGPDFLLLLLHNVPLEALDLHHDLHCCLHLLCPSCT